MSVVLATADGQLTVTPSSEFAGQPAAAVASQTTDFLAWSTTRLPWRSLVSIEGDEAVAERFLNALNLV
jgi:hypothetical protein